MNGRKLSFFTLIFFFGATILVPVLSSDSASADCGAYVRDYDGCGRCVYDGELLRCGDFAVRDCYSLHDCDRSGVFSCAASLECDRSGALECVRSAGVWQHCVREYRCNLCGCTWIH